MCEVRFLNWCTFFVGFSIAKFEVFVVFGYIDTLIKILMVLLDDNFSIR